MVSHTPSRSIMQGESHVPTIRRPSSGRPRIGRRCAAWFALVAMAAISGGCGGGDAVVPAERPQRDLYGAPPDASSVTQGPPAVSPSSDASTSVPGQPHPGMPPGIGIPPAPPGLAGAGDPNAVPGAEQGVAPGGPPAGGGNPLMAIAGMGRFMRPNYGKWKPEDFQNAKARRNPQLIEALAEVGPNRASSDKFAILLVDLLTKKIDDTQQFDPGAPPSGFPGGAPGGPPGFAPPPPSDPKGLSGPPAGGRFGENEQGSLGKSAGPGFGSRFGGDAPPGGMQPGGAPPGISPFGGQPGDPNAVPSGPFTDEQLAGSAIGALGSNRTPTARNALKQIVQGQLATIVPDSASASLALQAILLRPSPEEEDLVLFAAMSPTKVRPTPKPDGMQVTELQTQAIAAIDTGTPPAVQARLIKRVIASKGSAEERKPLLDVLVKPVPASVAGQVDLFVSLAKDDPLRKTLEANFAWYSATALDQLFRLPPDTLPPPPAAGQLAPSSQSQQAGIGGLGGGGREPGLRGLEGKGGGGRFGAPPMMAQGGGLGQGAGLPPPGFGQPPGLAPEGGQAAQGLDDATIRLIAENLWTDKVVKALEQESVGLEGHAEKFSDPLQLGVTMPVQSMRTLVEKLQREWWRDGTTQLPMGQHWGDLVRDPALLIVFKRTPRKEDPAVREARIGKATPAPGTPGAAAAGARRPPRGNNQQTGPNAEAQAKEEQARYQWMSATEEFVQSLNARFYAAAKAAAPAADGPDEVPRFKPSAAAAQGNVAAAGKSAADKTLIAKTAPATAVPVKAAATDKTGAVAAAAAPYDPAKLPLTLHDGATVVAEYHLNWPADVQGKLRGVSVTPLIVHYVRIEQQGNLTKTLLHYQKQLRGVTSRLLPNGRWLDYNGIGGAPGQARSVDVMITRGGAAAGEAGKAEAAEDLVVEILSVEAPEPKLKAPAT